MPLPTTAQVRTLPTIGGRRCSVPIPGDFAEPIDVEIAAHPWVADAATGLSLRR